jgi:hypothetical protein
MRKTLAMIAVVAGLVAACSGSGATGSLQPGGTPAGAPQAAGTPAGATPAGATQAATGATGATGSPVGGAPSSPTACSLITQAEAAAALGYPVAAGTAPVPGENTCDFSGPIDKLNFVEVGVVDPAEFLPTRASVPGSFTVTPASGIGDEAYYQKDFLPNTGGETSIELSVRKGQIVFVINVLDHAQTDGPLMAAEKTLALAAVGRI